MAISSGGPSAFLSKLCRTCIMEAVWGWLTVQSSNGGTSVIPCPTCNRELWDEMHNPSRSPTDPSSPSGDSA